MANIATSKNYTILFQFSGRNFKNLSSNVIITLINPKFSYENEDGTVVKQEGELKMMGGEDMGEAVKGSYSYQDDEGNTYSISYTADENGYRPVSRQLFNRIPKRILLFLVFQQKFHQFRNFLLICSGW